VPTAMPDLAVELDVDLERLLSEAVDLPYEVVLHNDDVNTFEYVTVVLMRVFAYPPGRARTLAERTDRDGQTVVWYGARDEAVTHTRTLLSHGLTATTRKGS
jgi:ATP-dependent Clp protease adaptor protein ClpS